MSRLLLVNSSLVNKKPAAKASYGTAPVCKVVFACEDSCLFPQATGAGLLPFNRLCRDSLDLQALSHSTRVSQL